MARTWAWAMPASLLLLYIVVLLQAMPISAKSRHASHWCKCVCFSNYTILELSWPEKPSQPCLSCTKQWCLDQRLDICHGAVLEPTDPDTASGKEGDVEARCFERDSPRDQTVVTIFLVVVFGLLVGAAVKGRMDKANITLNWNSGTRRWWESWLPTRQQGAPYNPNAENGSRRTRAGGYVDLNSEETQGF